MSAKISFLDVTLREGGNLNQFNFSVDLLEKIIAANDKAGVDYIQVGYRNGFWKPNPDIGPTGLCQKEYLTQCKRLMSFSKMSVIVYPKNVQQADFEEMRVCGVDTVCVIFPFDDVALGKRCIEMAKNYGFEVVIDINHISECTLEGLDHSVAQVIPFEPDLICLADSNGNVIPSQVASFFSYLTKKYDQSRFGFHAHDNLLLAQANAWAAIQHGAKHVDASLAGVGKGVGNLRVEGIAALLLSQNYPAPDLCILLRAANEVNQALRHIDQPLPIKEMIKGVFNISIKDVLDSNLCLEEYYAAAKQIKLKKDDR